MKQTVVALLVFGSVLVGVGIVLMVGCWPGEEANPFYGVLDGEPKVTETGSEIGTALGAVMAGGGQIMVTVAVIAMGVRVAIQDHDVQRKGAAPVQ
jgi:hypothetical protein